MLHSHPIRLRRILSLMLIILLLSSLTGCFKDKEPDSTGDSQNPQPSETQTQTTPPETQPPETLPPETLPPTTQAPEPTSNPSGNYSVFGIVTAEKLNIRKEPNAEADKAGYYVKDDRVEILWNDISLQDITEEARAELYKAQAMKYRSEANKGGA